MRVLFSSTAGDGHLNPMLPLARAMQAAGADVGFAMAAEFAPRLTGFCCFPSGVGVEELNRRTHLPNESLSSLSKDLQIFVKRFALADAPQRVLELGEIASTWAPDLVVTEPCDLAAPVVAAARGVPLALHSFGRPMGREHYEACQGFVAPLWRTAGVEAAPLCGIYGRWYVDICPPRLRDEEVPQWARALPMRPTPPQEPGPAPEWVASLPDRSTVYVTLGTLFNDLPRFRPVLDALAELECNVIVTVGRKNDPDELGAIPANCTVKRFVPQDVLLPHVDVMVAHGGSGSMLAGFAHGIPQLLLPTGADQVPNARAAEREGLARVLMPDEVTVDALRQGVASLLRVNAYRAEAAALADEIARMPGPDEVARALLSELTV